MSDKPKAGMNQILGAKPRYDPFEEERQFRLKVQTFTNAPPVLTIREVDFGRDIERYMSAYHRSLPFTTEGQLVNVASATRKPRDPDRAPDPENQNRAHRRAKKRLQDTIRELVPDGMLTLTSRRRLVDRDVFWRCVQRLFRSVKAVCPEFAAVVVPEKHLSGEHLHAHIAYRSLSLGFNALRRLWHMALLAEDGVRPGRMLRGADAPGNIDVKKNKGPGGVAGCAKRIGRYMGKYLSKELSSEFGRKSFSHTQGIKLAQAQRYYLAGLTIEEAKREALGIVGIGSAVHEALHFWHPPGSSLWHLVCDDHHMVGEPPTG